MSDFGWNGQTTAPLPYHAESIENQRDRYPLAVSDVIDIESVQLGTSSPPFQSLKHVFDSCDGLRLIISRESIPGMGIALHLSASAEPETPLYQAVQAGRLRVFEFCEIAERRFREISLDEGPLPIKRISFRGIPHWYRPERGTSR